MRPDSGIDQTSLAWLKPEIDASLARAGEALERYSEENFTGDGATAASIALHEVLGGLRMLELYGAALVAEEMEQLVSELVEGRVQRVEDALTSLLRAILQLPDYLERLQSGYRDVPIVLLPLLNDLRSCRGEKLLTESVLLIPPSDPELPHDLPRPSERVGSVELERTMLALRRDWQFALLQWFRGQHNDEAVAKLSAVCDGLLGVISKRSARQLWWVAGAVTDALREHSLDASISTKLLYGRLDRELKRLIDQGETLYDQAPASDLLRSLLYYAAQAGEGGRITGVQAAYGLGDLMPSAEEVDEARGALSGRNSSLLNSVVQALEEELMRVKDALDLYLRGNRSEGATLQPELDVLDRVADTLGMVGMGIERSQVQAQRAALASLASVQNADEQALLDIAGALLQVESSLQAHRERLGVQPGNTDGREGSRSSAAERRRLTHAVLREAAANLQQSKELFLSHLSTPSGSPHIDSAVVLLRDVAGALRLLEFEGAADRALALAGFLHGQDSAPESLTATQIDGFADALSGLEFYLELVADHDGLGDERLQRVTDALARLGHWPAQISLRQLFGDGDADGAKSSTPLATAGDASVGNAAGSSAADQVPMPVPQMVADTDAIDHPVTPPGDHRTSAESEQSESRFTALVESMGYGFDPASSADEDIRGTFLDELTEEIGQLDELLPKWQTMPDDLETLRSIRRSFHTIKGSGRMVGARLLGEFAWQVETLLNRVLSAHRPATVAVVRLVENAVATLPEFHAALCGDVQPRRDVAGIMATAEALIDGNEVMLPPASSSVAGPASGTSSGVSAASPVDVGEQGGGTSASQSGSERLDPVLLDILRSEVAGHLGVIETYLHDARGNSALAIVPEHLLRAVHTLNGAFGAVELGEVTVLTSALEIYVRRLRGVRRAPISDGYDAIAASSAWLGDVVDRLDRGDALPPFDDVPARLQALAADLPEQRDDTAWLMGEPVPSVEELLSAADAPDTRVPVGMDGVPELEPVVSTHDQDDGEDGTDRPRAFSDTPAFDAGAPFDIVDVTDAIERPVSGVTDRSEPGDVDASELDAVDSSAIADVRTAVDDPATADTSTESGEPTVAEPPVADDAVGIETSADKDTLIFDDFAVDATPEVEPDIAATVTEPEVTPPRAQDENRPAPVSSAPDNAPGGADRDVLRALLDNLPAVPPSDVDPDLAELFREEARELLDRCEQHLSRREAIGPAALSLELARELHTLKGGARMAGFTDAGDLGHAMESLLESAANDQRDLDDADINLIGRCLDRLNHQVFVLEASAVPAPSSSEDAPVPSARSAGSLSATSDEAVANAAPSAPVRPKPATPPRPVSITPLAPPVAAPVDAAVGEFVRVRADQLDSLVNLAGEVGIIRTRLEQQVGAFRFSLEEFEQTVQRLREQLRKLEIEAETQILSREVRVQEQSTSGFDPLEMDRFSQLQQLSRALAESMSDLQSIQGLLDEHTRLAESLLLQQSRAGAELQEGLMRARMVPFESMLPRLRRLVRQEADALGKRVRLTVEGAQGELDRGVLERMAAPFEHMLRNALVHGLEKPDERRSTDKSEEGEVRIRVAREATEVVIEVADDGRGINPQRVRRTAIERGLLSVESDLSDRDIYAFILEPGFSTAGELTQYAGRGVGMDVVASEIKQLGGSLTIDSIAGKGATFRIRLPYTLAVSQAVLVRVADHTFAIPMVGVQGIVRLSYANYKERVAIARPLVEYAGDDYEIYDLDTVLGLPSALLDDTAQVPLLMVRAGDLRVALRVDSLLGGREIVVKPVGPQLARIPGVFGATILGDGAVVVILDVSALLRRAAALRDRGDAPLQSAPQPAVRQRPLVLVVDDSITMRKVSSRVLEREGYEVQTAKDGLDALEHVHERLPDIILLDLEMPRMDGYEFAGYMRNDPRFRDVPIVVITSRVGEKHRARAFELGVNRYLGKPYQESEMLDAVIELLAERRAATREGDLKNG
jgi:chemosensory pili system protein ChpA (sensor histidine kinase/response regulator)